MRNARLILVAGLPGAGKSTLARRLAHRYGVPQVAKDLIKEPLLDVLGARDAAASKRLSDASFAVLFAVARELAVSGTAFVLEGNFRPGEHESELRRLLLPGVGAVAGRLLQVLCRLDETERRARLAARTLDANRHPGHLLAQDAAPHDRGGDPWLELPGERLLYDSGAIQVREQQTTVEGIDRWWRA